MPASPTQDPRWEPAPDPRTARRSLSRDTIVDAAVRLADEEGLDAVSMPRLARTLGAAPMSLYRHVPHKDALVDLMIDAAVGEPPAVSGGVRAGLEAWARANRAVFTTHPWTLPLVTGPRRMGPAECVWAETALALVVADGLPVDVAFEVLHVVNSYVLGSSSLRHDRAPLTSDLAHRAADMPLFTGLFTGAPPDTTGPDGVDPVFEAGLARVLDGVQAHLTRTDVRFS
ncbi:TetR/AcrR family transcriptional regulator [Pseudonocardia sp. KRD291]|uniref:TetR/AcrR family transcriptional regulator n=1 Tax=Pseudonocardia sp. KRD291 TaxID=2792007 RepID=UPI001C4A71E4|nr:TetR/AcrR family transcriptional regulator [Pseudonocardia sp. KRD291]MBW0105814.1 TetR/AcrR family transcriptional regulator C-terminal domain-containing protein [Pseudonocardia sp. KRD291]